MRATPRLHSERYGGQSSPVASHARRITLRSKPALCATSTSAPANAHSRSSCSLQLAASATSCARIPWIRTFHSWNSSCPAGGRISQPVCATTTPSRTRTRPTEHADAGEEFAVSKSIAVKSRGTDPPSFVSPRSSRQARRGAPDPGVGSDHGRACDELRIRDGQLREGPAGVPRRGRGLAARTAARAAPAPWSTSERAPASSPGPCAGSAARRCWPWIPDPQMLDALRERTPGRRDRGRDRRGTAAAGRERRRRDAGAGLALGGSGRRLRRDRPRRCGRAACSG